MRPEGNLQSKVVRRVAPQSKENELRIILPARENAVRRGLKSIKSGLGPIGFSSDELASLELVLAEILNNIVEHAYRGNEAGIIEIQLSQTTAGLWCTVIDTGAMMPNGEPPLGMQCDLNCDVADLPEGGFGWFLIRELAHDLEYTHEEGQNRLSFRMSIGRLN